MEMTELEVKENEILKLQESLKEMQLVVDETKALLSLENEKTKKAIEEVAAATAAAAIKEIPVLIEDTEKIESLTSEVDNLKMKLEVKEKEISKLHISLQEMQTEVSEVKALRHDEHENTKKTILEDTEKIESLTSQVDNLKTVLEELKKKEILNLQKLLKEKEIASHKWKSELEEMKKKEILNLQKLLKEKQIEVDETYALLQAERENGKRTIEEAAVVAAAIVKEIQVPLEDIEKSVSLTIEVDNLKMEHPLIDLDFGLKYTGFSDRVLRIEVVSTKNPALRPRENDIEVKSFKVNSRLLAESSSLFDKYFKNEMKESQQKEATIRVCASDEVAFMDILKFIYTNTLSAAPADEVAFLLNRMIVAYKFGVVSCITYCNELWKKIPMSVESAISYLELPASVSLSELLRPIIYAAKEYLVMHFSDLNESQVEALFLKIVAPSSKDTTTTNFNSLDRMVRIYIHGPIRVMHIEGSPRPCCVVYFYLGKDECEELLPNDYIDSPYFVLGGREFNLIAKYSSRGQQNAFGVFLCTKGRPESNIVTCEFAIMKKSSKKFHKMSNYTNVYTNAAAADSGHLNLLGISVNEFMSKDSDYFTNGILQIKTHITIINPST